MADKTYVEAQKLKLRAFLDEYEKNYKSAIDISLKATIAYEFINSSVESIVANEQLPDGVKKELNRYKYELNKTVSSSLIFDAFNTGKGNSEIAEILNLSVKTVSAKRYYLRKKGVLPASKRQSASLETKGMVIQLYENDVQLKDIAGQGHYSKH